MKLGVLIALLGGVPGIIGAGTVEWTAMGEVTGVDGFAALGIVEGEQVEVEFSYDESASATGVGIRGFTGVLNEWRYFDGIDLRIRVRIGSRIWDGSVETASSADAFTVWIQDMIIDAGPEFLVATVSDATGRGGLFPSFPGKSATGESALIVNLRDEMAPHSFLTNRFLPRASEPGLGHLTSATGEICSDAECISFAIDTASIVVADGAAGAPVVPSISVVGGEVTLGWSAEIGADYTIRWSENGRQWEVLTVRVADEVDETYTFSPVNGAAAQYYRVSRDLGGVIE